jgi:radical SAM protein with 4Fe4S-binding SPASM domain
MSEQTYYTKKNIGLWQGQDQPLTHLDIELTERCNNNCIHCSICRPEGDESLKKRELPSGALKDILSQAAGLGALTVRFTGGEPLLRDDFEDIYVSARKLGMRVILFTNARLITRRIAELLSRIPPLERIEVSVYGMSGQSYEYVTRAKGSYKEFLKGVDLLLEYRIPFIVKGSMFSFARHEIDKFEEWAGSIPWMESPPALVMLLALRDRRDSDERNALIRSLRMSPEDYLTALSRHRAGYIKETLQFCGEFIGQRGGQLFTCGAGYSPCLDAYGDLQMCLGLRHPDTVFDMATGSLSNALAFFEEKRGTKASDKAYLEKCAVCFLKGLCEQCPARSWSEHGTLDTPVEYLCDIAHARARDILLLDEDEKGWQVRNWRERVARSAEKLL